MQCSDCFGDNFVTDYSQGDLICMQCGLVAEQHIFDDRPQFADAERTAPMDCGEFIPADGLAGGAACIAAPQYKMGAAATSRGKLTSLKRSAAQTSAERRVNTASLDTVCRFLHVNDSFHKQARQFYADVSRSKPYKGETSEALQACALYYVFILEKVPRSIGEICRSFSIAEVNFTKADKIFREGVKGAPYYQRLFESADSSDLVRRTVQLLCLKVEDEQIVNRAASSILRTIADRKLLPGRSSGALVTSSIYLALIKAGHKPVKAVLCEQLQLTSPVTLTSILKQLPVDL